MSRNREKWVRGWWIGFCLAIVWCAVVLVTTAVDFTTADSATPAPAAPRESV